MTPEIRKKFLSLFVGQSMLITWDKLPKPRPEGDGYVVVYSMTFYCKPVPGGLLVERTV